MGCLGPAAGCMVGEAARLKGGDWGDQGRRRSRRLGLQERCFGGVGRGAWGISCLVKH